MDGLLATFIAKFMRQAGRLVPARVDAALVLLERLRQHPDLRLESHQVRGSSGLRSHERFGASAHDRLHVEKITKTFGRRSSHIGLWGQELLDLVRELGFEGMDDSKRQALIDQAQVPLANCIRDILESEPLVARLKGRTAPAIIREILQQAESRGRSGEVAQYLVGAKLMIRLQREIPVVGWNKSDRESWNDADARSGDFEMDGATIEVAMGSPDDKHLEQIAEALERSNRDFWLLTRHDRVLTWQLDLAELEHTGRVVVTAVDVFVGQNITEMGGFSAKGKHKKLEELFGLYNERWVRGLGKAGIQIQLVK